MAYDVVRVIPNVRLENRTKYEGTGTIYVLKMESEDKAYSWDWIWYAGAPSTNFTAAPVGSMFFDITNGNAYLKEDTADTWTDLTVA